MEYTGSVRTKRGKNGEVSYQIVIEGERDPVTGKADAELPDRPL